MVEGLEVGRKLVTQGMFVVGDLNHRNFEAFKASGILVFPVISDGIVDGCCLTARPRTDLEKLVLMI
jgi:hypothetical protein